MEAGTSAPSVAAAAPAPAPAAGGAGAKEKKEAEKVTAAGLVSLQGAMEEGLTEYLTQKGLTGPELAAAKTLAASSLAAGTGAKASCGSFVDPKKVDDAVASSIGVLPGAVTTAGAAVRILGSLGGK